jgi:hypothetical protein
VHEQLFGIGPPGPVLSGNDLVDVWTAVPLPVPLSCHVPDMGVHVTIWAHLSGDEALAGHADAARIQRRGLREHGITLNELQRLKAK